MVSSNIHVGKSIGSCVSEVKTQVLLDPFENIEVTLGNALVHRGMWQSFLLPPPYLMLLHLLAELEGPIVYSQVTQLLNIENEIYFFFLLEVHLPTNQASQPAGQMPAGDNTESSYRFQFSPGDWYQKERQHNIHRLQHNDFIDVLKHCSFHGLLTWSGVKANLLNVFYRKNRTSLSWGKGKKNQFFLSLVVFL